MVKKKFIELSTGKVFEVTDHFEDIAILDNKVKVNMKRLYDKSIFDEYIDPNSFFRNEGLVNAFTEKIRQLPTSQINESEKYDPYLNQNIKIDASVNSSVTPSTYESAVLPYDPEQERLELMEKAKRMFQNNSQKTNIGKLSEFLIEDDDDYDGNYNPEVSSTNYEEEKIEKPVEIPKPKPQVQQIPQPMNQNIDPIISMFRNVKRNTDFHITFSLNHKIPRLDFIEMMEDSYNTSIIEFLSEEFTNAILLNPSIIKEKISDEIRRIVYKDSSDEVPSPKKKSTKKTEDND